MSKMRVILCFQRPGWRIPLLRWGLLTVWLCGWLCFFVWGAGNMPSAWHAVLVVLFCCWALTMVEVVVYRFLPPYVTPLRIGRWWNSLRTKEPSEVMRQRFVPIGRMSHFLYDAANCSEDIGLFLYHRGFNVSSMIGAYLSNEAGNPLRGGSTISQQTAKNVFLVHRRTWLRKLLEAYFTVLIEMFWGKRRIMECYLNVVEFGRGVYGCEAASQYYFHHSAAELTAHEAALLIASLPMPSRRNPDSPTEIYLHRVQVIMERLHTMPAIDWNYRRADLDIDKLNSVSHSLLFFFKWVALHRWKRHNTPRRSRTTSHRLFRPWRQLGVAAKLWRVVWVAFVSLWLFTLLQVLVYKFVEPPITPHMLASYVQQRDDHLRCHKFERQCVAIDEVSPLIVMATVNAEDWLFTYHHGFLFYGLHRAYLDYEQGKALRGGSTISQQTAKNCFLPFGKSLVRKVVEAHYTFLIETLWGKKRIMECYLNLAEWGDGIYGCEAACQHYFHHSAKNVTLDEAVQLAAMLSAPLEANPYHHTPLYDSRVAKIEKYIHGQQPVVWNERTEDRDPKKVAQAEKGLFFFLKWVVAKKIRESTGLASD